MRPAGREGQWEHLAEAKATGNGEATAASGKYTPFINMISDYKAPGYRNHVGRAWLPIHRTFITMSVETAPLCSLHCIFSNQHTVWFLVDAQLIPTVQWHLNFRLTDFSWNLLCIVDKHTGLILHLSPQVIISDNVERVVERAQTLRVQDSYHTSVSYWPGEAEQLIQPLCLCFLICKIKSQHRFCRAVRRLQDEYVQRLEQHMVTSKPSLVLFSANGISSSRAVRGGSVCIRQEADEDQRPTINLRVMK